MAKYKYEVFVSHNRMDKPLVRQLVAQWRKELGLRVFFDEDSVLPGEEIVSAIENGLQKSRQVVLILSHAAVKSKWIALEAAIAIHADPSARNRRIIPVIIDGLPVKRVRPSLRTLNIVDLSDPQNREEQYRFLLSALNISKENLPSCPWAVNEQNGPVSDSDNVPQDAVEVKNASALRSGEIHITFRGYKQLAYSKREMVFEAIDQLLRTGATVIISHDDPNA